MTEAKNTFEAGTVGTQITVANSGTTATPESFNTTANALSDEFVGGRTNLTGWTLLFDDDFPSLAAEGSFLSTYGAGGPTQYEWDAYPSDYLTTEAQNTGSGNHYATTNISVVSGITGATGNCMRLNLHRDASDGKAWGAAPIPLFSSMSGHRDAQTYGRYEYRVKADAVAGWHLAWLLWPLSDDDGTIPWPGGGETDFPEGDLNGGVAAYHHWYGGTSGGSQDAYETVIPWNQWNVYVIEWKPNSCEYFINGTSIGHTTGSHVVPNPMRTVLQSETSSASGQGAANVYIDYVSIWSYTP